MIDKPLVEFICHAPPEEEDQDPFGSGEYDGWDEGYEVQSCWSAFWMRLQRPKRRVCVLLLLDEILDPLMRRRASECEDVQNDPISRIMQRVNEKVQEVRSMQGRLRRSRDLIRSELDQAFNILGRNRHRLLSGIWFFPVWTCLYAWRNSMMAPTPSSIRGFEEECVMQGLCLMSLLDHPEWENQPSHWFPRVYLEWRDSICVQGDETEATELLWAMEGAASKWTKLCQQALAWKTASAAEHIH